MQYPYMTENSPIHPPSKKGEVRKQLHEMIMNEMEKMYSYSIIARSADFYGPDTNNRLLEMMVVNNL